MTVKDYLQKIVIDFELRAVVAIKECFANENP
jgi:hypothetical protein